MFEDPAIMNRLRLERQDYFSTYVVFIRHMCSYFLSLPGSFSDHLWSLQYKAFEWAYSIVESHSVTNRHLIIPFMDYRNFITTDSVPVPWRAHS